MRKSLLLILSFVWALSIGATENVRIHSLRTEMAGRSVARAPYTLTKSAVSAATTASSETIESLLPMAKALAGGKKHVPALKGLYGTYVEDTPGATDGLEPTLVCMPTEVQPYEFTDPDTGEYYVLLNFNRICQGVANVYGEYAPEEGIIFIPAQVCFDDPSNTRVPKASLFGIESIDAQGHLTLSDGIYLRVEEDANGLYITMDETAQVGWALYAEEGEWKGSVVGYAESLTLNPANYYLTYAYVDIGLPVTDRQWLAGEQRSFVEDLGDEVLVHGWLGEYAIRLKVKEDGSIVLANGQRAYYSQSDRTWWGCYTFGTDRKMTVDPTVESPVIKNTADTYIFGSANADGSINWDIFCWGYELDGQGKWTGVEFAQIGLVPNAVWENLNGIEENLSTVNSQSSTTYDLTGRRASSAARGLFIQNGRVVVR